MLGPKLRIVSSVVGAALAAGAGKLLLLLSKEEKEGRVGAEESVESLIDEEGGVGRFREGSVAAVFML